MSSYFAFRLSPTQQSCMGLNLVMLTHMAAHCRFRNSVGALFSESLHFLHHQLGFSVVDGSFQHSTTWQIFRNTFSNSSGLYSVLPYPSTLTLYALRTQTFHPPLPSAVVLSILRINWIFLTHSLHIARHPKPWKFRGVSSLPLSNRIFLSTGLRMRYIQLFEEDDSF